MQKLTTCLLASLISLVYPATARSSQDKAGVLSPSPIVPAPDCYEASSPEVRSMRQIQKNNSDNNHKYDGYKKIFEGVSGDELLARLVYAEALAGECPEHTEELIPLIAGVVESRLRKHEGNIRNVIFKRDQFASSLNIYDSKKWGNSRYEEFLCPENQELYAKAYNEVKSLRSGSMGSEAPKTAQEGSENYYLNRHRMRGQGYEVNPQPWHGLGILLTVPENTTKPCASFYYRPRPSKKP